MAGHWEKRNRLRYLDDSSSCAKSLRAAFDEVAWPLDSQAEKEVSVGDSHQEEGLVPREILAGQYELLGGSVLRDGTILESSTLLIGQPSDAVAGTFRLRDDEIVIPGLADLHCHLGAGGRNENGVRLDELFATGVTLAADGGSFGPSSIQEAIQYFAGESERAGVEVKLWSYLFGTGLHDSRDMRDFDGVAETLSRLVERIGRSWLSGIKVRLGQSPAVGDEALFAMALVAAERIDCRLMVHLTNADVDVDELFARLRPGDVVSHAFHGRKGSIVTASGSVRKSVEQAKKRGVLLDVAHGRNHFSWKVFETCLASGIEPDVISTDLTKSSFGQDPVVSLPFVMSKLSSVGLNSAHALSAASETPRRVLGVMPELKRVALVMRRQVCNFEGRDAEGDVRKITSRYIPIRGLRAVPGGVEITDYSNQNE